MSSMSAVGHAKKKKPMKDSEINVHNILLEIVGESIINKIKLSSLVLSAGPVLLSWLG